MDQLSYTDYYYADRYVLFTGAGVDDIVPFEQMVGDAQLNYQRIELRWNGIDQVQQFSVTKDGIAVLETIHTVGKNIDRWAKPFLARLIDEQMDETPCYRVCLRTCNGPGLDGEIGEDEVFWDGHERFYFQIYNDVFELHHADPELFKMPTDARGVFDTDMMVGFGDVAEIDDDDLELVGAEFGADLGTVLDEQSRSKFVDSIEHFIHTIDYRLSVSDITIPHDELLALKAAREEQAVLKQRREEISFLYSARNRLIILLILSPLAWIYVRSAAVSVDLEEPSYLLSFGFGLAIWIVWHAVFVARSFRKGGDGKKNLRIIRQRIARNTRISKKRKWKGFDPFFKRREADGEYVLTVFGKFVFFAGPFLLLAAISCFLGA